MSKGDKVVVLVDAGGSEAREFVLEADKAGRRVEVHQGRGDERTFIIVELVTRNGRPVLAWRFMATRVVALIEQRQDEADDDDEIPDPVPGQVQMGLLTNADPITFSPTEAQDIVLVPAKPITWGSGAAIKVPESILDHPYDPGCAHCLAGKDWGRTPEANGQDVAAAANLYIDAREETDAGTDEEPIWVAPEDGF
jgi:hypothetical protein